MLAAGSAGAADMTARPVYGASPAPVYIWTGMSLVDIGSLDLAAGEPLRGFDDGAQRVAVIRKPGRALACSTNWPPGARALVVTIEALTPNS